MQGFEGRRRFPERKQARHVRKCDGTAHESAFNDSKIGK